MNINIVVFGCDNSGKTTICNKIKEYLTDKGLPVVYHKSVGPRSLMEQVNFLTKTLYEDNLEEVKVQIFDRFPVIEEEVCGKILRNKSNFETFPEYVKSILNKVTLFIHCDPGMNSITNWGTREQMDGIKENAMALNEGYSVFKNFHGIESRVIEYNYNKNDWEYIAGAIWSLYYVLGGGKNEYYQCV